MSHERSETLEQLKIIAAAFQKIVESETALQEKELKLRAEEERRWDETMMQDFEEWRTDRARFIVETGAKNEQHKRQLDEPLSSTPQKKRNQLSPIPMQPMQPIQPVAGPSKVQEEEKEEDVIQCEIRLCGFLCLTPNDMVDHYKYAHKMATNKEDMKPTLKMKRETFNKERRAWIDKMNELRRRTAQANTESNNPQ